MYGLKSSSLYAFTAAYAVPASCGDASIRLTWLHSGNPFGVTLLQVLPPSFVTWISPSSVPAHNTPFCAGDSASVNTVSKNSTVVLSLVSTPPDDCCLLLSLRVRSGLITVQLCPWSVLLNTTSAVV